jgi:hypothetical protein
LADGNGEAARQGGTLHEAIRDGLVSAVFSGTGGSSGDVVQVRVTRRRGSGRLHLSVIPGSKLISATAGVQNMVLLGVRGRDMGGGQYRPESEIVVDGTPVTYILSAACAEFEKENPGDSTRFALEEPGDPVLACIARLGADQPIPTFQAAVWMHTDKASYSLVSSRFEVSRVQWAAGEALLRSCLPASSLGP